MARKIDFSPKLKIPTIPHFHIITVITQASSFRLIIWVAIDAAPIGIIIAIGITLLLGSTDNGVFRNLAKRPDKRSSI